MNSSVSRQRYSQTLTPSKPRSYRGMKKASAIQVDNQMIIGQPSRDGENVWVAFMIASFLSGIVGVRISYAGNGPPVSVPLSFFTDFG